MKLKVGQKVVIYAITVQDIQGGRTRDEMVKNVKGKVIAVERRQYLVSFKYKSEGLSAWVKRNEIRKA